MSLLLNAHIASADGTLSGPESEQPTTKRPPNAHMAPAAGTLSGPESKQPTTKRPPKRPSDGVHFSEQYKLFDDLFNKFKYIKQVRPILDNEEVINIKFEIALFNVLELVS